MKCIIGEIFFKQVSSLGSGDVCILWRANPLSSLCEQALAIAHKATC